MASEAASTDGPRRLPVWDGTAYAANTGHHRAFDDVFLESTPLLPGDRVLDLGCGSGDFTSKVAELVPDGHVVGLDAEPSMLDEARRRAGSNQSFVLATLQELDSAIPEPASFDVVVSRAVLHWVPAGDLGAVFTSIARLLQPGGWVRIECGGVGNVRAGVELLDEVSARFGGPRCPWTFADPATALDWLEGAGLDHEAGGAGWVRAVAQRRRFDEAAIRGFLDSQSLLGYTATMPADRVAGFRAAVAELVPEMRRADGSYDQTFVRLDLRARKPPTHDF